MTAIVPVNLAAIRVSAADASNVVKNFKGQTAVFNELPYKFPPTQANPGTSTGDQIARSLSTQPAYRQLKAGIHLHWELPDYFKRAVQARSQQSGRPEGPFRFPPAPNRWLVVRSVSIGNTLGGGGVEVHSNAWIVESDYVSAQPASGPDGLPRHAISVPLTPHGKSAPPFMYMGRVLEAGTWDPASENTQDYLPSFSGPDGAPLSLNSIGFVGPAFAAYYPDCCSVFGFWDNFYDLPKIGEKVANNEPIDFTASYQVHGWHSAQQDDPLTGLKAAVRSTYDDYVDQTKIEKTPIRRNPQEVFKTLTEQQYGWLFQKDAISWTLGSDGKIATLDLPQDVLLCGMTQQIGWNQQSPSTDTPFLSPDGSGDVWTDDVKIAIGNTTVEAVSALIREELGPEVDPDVLENYEFLLDALQLGILRDIASATGSQLTYLVETVHAKAFAATSGGMLWTVTQGPSAGGAAPTEPVEVTLPLDLAEWLHLLNVAQQDYDRRLERIVELRKQLFMDWFIFVKQLVRTNIGSGPPPVVSNVTLAGFIGTRSSGELGAILAVEADTGTVQYTRDPPGIATHDTGDKASTRLVAAFGKVKDALAALEAPQALALEVGSNQPFWSPNEPVLTIEGDRIEPVRRNGTTREIDVRVTGELIDRLNISVAGPVFAVPATSVGDQYPVPASIPKQPLIKALIGESALLMPLFAEQVCASLATQGGNGNPAVSAPKEFVAALRQAQGGQSPLVGGAASGLFKAVHAKGYVPASNPVISVPAPLALTVGFTNAADAWPPSAVGWTAQTALPEFDAKRIDPFLPVWLLWNATLDPLSRGAGDDYVEGVVKDRFDLPEDAVDYAYRMLGDAPIPGLTTGNLVNYSGSIVLNRRPMASLADQIADYLGDIDPNSPVAKDLDQALELVGSRKIMSQALSGFNPAQTLREAIPQITVEDLVMANLDRTTPEVAIVAGGAAPNWYSTAFNSLAPISTGVLAQYNFGPLRAGFMNIDRLRIVDVFGQMLELSTPRTADGALTVTPSFDLAPNRADVGNAQKIYLPPRPLAPTRLDFNWLSARFDHSVPGIDGDFVLMNDHPATSPVCGWILPNHLDVALMFYDPDGKPIGSLQVQHGEVVFLPPPGDQSNSIGYLGRLRARTGAVDPINPHLLNFVAFLQGQGEATLNELMAAIEESDKFINPARRNQDLSLAVLIGRPLAIVRATAGLSSQGGVLPLSQDYTSPTSAFARAATQGWYDYSERQKHTAAALDGVWMPVRLGELSNIDDGLVAFLPERAGTDPYTVIYSPATKATSGGVIRPKLDTVELKINAGTTTLTLLVDPRAPVHATTGILPFRSLAIPPDQYARAMANLGVTFSTHPVLRTASGFKLPLPEQAGYDWAWVMAHGSPKPLAAIQGSDTALYGYSPQVLQDGWLRLAPVPPLVNLDEKGKP